MVWQCGEVGGVISMKTFGLPRILSVLSLVPLSPYTFSVIHSCSFSIVSCLRDKALHVTGDTGLTRVEHKRLSLRPAGL